jgi:hypothetical protein
MAEVGGFFVDAHDALLAFRGEAFEEAPQPGGGQTPVEVNSGI